MSEPTGTNATKRTIVLGASPNPTRYSYSTVRSLKRHGFELVALGRRPGNIDGTEILTGHPHLESIDTVTLYVGPDRQPELYSYIFELMPKRIIFNPGTENPELMKLALDRGIETINACSLVMLATGQY